MLKMLVVAVMSLRPKNQDQPFTSGLTDAGLRHYACSFK